MSCVCALIDEVFDVFSWSVLELVDVYAVKEEEKSVFLILIVNDEVVVRSDGGNDECDFDVACAGAQNGV